MVVGYFEMEKFKTIKSYIDVCFQAIFSFITQFAMTKALNLFFDNHCTPEFLLHLIIGLHNFKKIYINSKFVCVNSSKH